jgi:cell division protein FtsL
MVVRPDTETREMLGRSRIDLPRRVERTEPEKRYIFGGETRSTFPGYAARPNKKGVRRRYSIFNSILLLFGAAVAIILYIGNFVAVNQLAMEVNLLQAEYDKIINSNAALRAEINRKSGWERIGTIATEQLGLRYPKEQAIWFTVDEDKLEKAGAQ